MFGTALLILSGLYFLSKNGTGTFGGLFDSLPAMMGGPLGVRLSGIPRDDRGLLVEWWINGVTNDPGSIVGFPSLTPPATGYRPANAVELAQAGLH